MPETAVQRILREILEYRCPRYDQLPDIPLYSDQITDALNRLTAPLLGEDHAITAPMINNYVKQRLLPPPEKKRYGRDHLATLYCIALLKQTFTISEIDAMLRIQTLSYPFPVAYDYFCSELESALQAAFSTREFASSCATRVTPESELVRTAALSIAHKLFATKFIQLYAPTDHTAQPNP